ncbi:MAG: hypothetical protein J0H25_03245, partial [Rhizobiales bacterium]|nr:hypothetical protein [Hyphomicrobiales bacterium]
MIVHCVNPGGLDVVADWRERTRGQPWAGSEPPGRTHPVGHDLNRDWIMLTQPETRAVVERVFNHWRPVIVLDLHEMPPNGPRYALPPYVKPIDPSLPTSMSHVAGQLGLAIAAKMRREGKTGVATGLFFDAFSPARAYPPYHGGVRVLAEAAGTRLGLPAHLSADELASAPGFDPRQPSAAHPCPWQGGRWTLADVADYHRTAVVTTIIEGAHLALDQSEPIASGSFVIPPLPMQPDPGATKRLHDTLARGGVHLAEAAEPFHIGDVEFPAGSVIIDSEQPAWPWARSLLSVQHYPFMDGGSSRPPYDVTAQTLPLLMGVDAIRTSDRMRVATRSIERPIESPRLTLSGGPVAVYHSLRPDATQAGWAMTMLADAGIEPIELGNAAIRSGALDGLFVIILPHQRPVDVLNGLNLAEYPAEFTGGIGQAGLRKLKQWVRAGGLLIAIDGAAEAVVHGFHLPIEVVASGFYAPGSILRVELDAEHPIVSGGGSEMAIMSLTSAAFDLDRSPAPDVRAVARYPHDDPLLSGWLSGWERLAGQAAIVEQRLGAGAVLLFGCRPLFRGQTLSSRRLIVNATRNARKPRTQ